MRITAVVPITWLAVLASIATAPAGHAQSAPAVRPPSPPQREAAQPASAQLVGRVRSRGDHRPVFGAFVRVDEADALGEVTPEGRFALRLPPGLWRVRVLAPGYETAEFSEKLEPDQVLEVTYGLQPRSVHPYETVVRNERPRVEVSRTTLRDQELREVPGTGGDPFRVVMLLPGVSSVSTGVSYPIVRGTQPASTGYFLEGVRVPSLFHAFLGPAVVHPDFIDAMDFYPGVPPARFGRLMGGVVEGQLREPRLEQLHASVYADLLNLGGLVEVPIPSTGTSVTLGGRFSYSAFLLGLLARQSEEREVPSTHEPYQREVRADFYDYQARVVQKMPGGGKLRLLAFGSSDVAGIRSNDPSETALSGQSIFHRLDLRYVQPLPLGKASAGVTLGQDRTGVSTSQGGPDGYTLALTQGSVAGRLGWSASLGAGLEVEVGAELERRQTAARFSASSSAPSGSADSTLLKPRENGTVTGAHLQLVWKPAPRWTVTPGLRVDSYWLNPEVWQTSADPRLTVRHELSEALALKVGAGLVHQPPTLLINLPVVDLSSLRFGLQAGAQFDAGLEWRRDAVEVELNGYFDAMSRTVELGYLDVLQEPRRSASLVDPARRGRAYGLEVLVRHPLGGDWFGWLSYSLQRSERFERFARFDDTNRVVDTASGWVPFAFDQTHVLNAALSYRLPGNLTLGLVFHFNTGRPETGEISSRSMHVGIDPETGQQVWAYDDRDRLARLPPFYRLDVRVSKAWTFDDFILDAYLDVQNVTVSQEVLYQMYTETTKLEKKPFSVPIFLPVLGVKASF